MLPGARWLLGARPMPQGVYGGGATPGGLATTNGVLSQLGN
jgi:hypothetical protein